MNKVIVLIILFNLFSLIAFGDDITDSKNLGKNLGKDIQGTIGNKDSINERLYKPLTTEVKMNTLKNTYKCSSDKRIYTSNEECSQNCSGICSLNDFEAQIQCQSYKDGILLQGLPGNGGELKNIVVKIDENLDKIYETVFNTSNISGICTNGYVSCTPGTWNNCVFYEFGIKHICKNNNVIYNTYKECKDACPSLSNCQPTGSVYQIPRNFAQMEKLGNCYCTNNSCGVSAYNVLDGILNTIGGGIVSHLVDEKGLVISKTELNIPSMSLKYLVTDLTSCSDVNSNQKISSLKQSYKKKTLDGSQEVLSQINNPNSLYSLATKDPSDPSIRTCEIKHTPNVERSISYVTTTETEYRCSNPFYFNSKPYCEVWVSSPIEADYRYKYFTGVPYPGSNGRKYESFEHLLLVKKTSKTGQICKLGWSGNTPYNNFSGYENYVYHYYDGDYDEYACSNTSDWTNIYNDSFRNTVINNGTMNIRIAISDIYDEYYQGDGWTGNYPGYSRLKLAITYNPKYEKKIEIENLLIDINENNGCLHYINDSNCKLIEEKVNDLYQTVYGGTPQQVNVPQSCVDVHGQTEHYRVCEGGNRFYKYNTQTGQVTDIKTYSDNIGYFKIKRTYQCSNEKKYDFSKAKTNANLIGESYQKETGNFNYLKEDNSIGSGNAFVRNEESTPRCLLSCDVITDYNRDTILFPDNKLRNDTTNVNKETRECILDKVNNVGVCPTKSGEVIARDCGCVDRFAEPIGILSSVFEATKDISCSSYDQNGNCLGNIYIFSGNSMKCRKAGTQTGGSNCCRKGTTWFGMGNCNEEEKMLSSLRKWGELDGNCHYVGEYCSEKILGTCVQKKQTYCCFSSPLARIIQEQGRAQLGKSFGSAKSPNCSGLTPDEFQKIDWDKVDLSEYISLEVNEKITPNASNKLKESLRNINIPNSR